MTSDVDRVDRRAVLMAGAALLAGGAARAQPAWPSRPLRMLVGYSAGGGVDAMARLLAPRIAALLGQQVVVENRAGAAGLIAGDAAAKAAPDGYTLMLGDSSLLIAQHLQPKMSFDPIKSFAPVAGVVMLPLAIIVANDFPARTPRELVALLKANPPGIHMPPPASAPCTTWVSRCSSAAPGPSWSTSPIAAPPRSCRT